MTNKDILDIAMRQSAADFCCSPEDFLKEENVIVRHKLTSAAKRYYSSPLPLMFISYGNNVVAAAEEKYLPLAEEYLASDSFYHLFETPAMNMLTKRVAPDGLRICYMAEYYLPKVELIHDLDCPFRLKTLTQKDFAGLYLPEWSNALCAERRELDVMAVGAYDGERLIGLAGCSADADMMLQIGVDVLPKYRRMGVASAVTSRLAMLIFECGKVPFYCSAWSNIRSVRNAVKCGFIPAWVELTVKPE